MANEFGTLFSQIIDEMQAIKAQMAANHSETKDKLSSIRTEMAVITERHCEVKEKVDDHDKVIYGNGRQGLLTTVALNKRETAIISAGIGVAVSAAIGWIFKQ